MNLDHEDPVKHVTTTHDPISHIPTLQAAMKHVYKALFLRHKQMTLGCAVLTHAETLLAIHTP